MSGPRLSEAQKDEIVELYREGLNGAWIAQKYGVDPSYPRILARRREVEKREES